MKKFKRSIALLLLVNVFFACNYEEQDAEKVVNTEEMTEAQLIAKIDRISYEVELKNEKYLNSIGGADVLDKQANEGIKQSRTGIKPTNNASGKLGEAAFAWLLSETISYGFGIGADGLMNSLFNKSKYETPNISAAQISTIVGDEIRKSKIATANQNLQSAIQIELQNGQNLAAISKFYTSLNVYLEYKEYSPLQCLNVLNVMKVAFNREIKRQGGTPPILIKYSTQLHNFYRMVYNAYNEVNFYIDRNDAQSWIFARNINEKLVTHYYNDPCDCWVGDDVAYMKDALFKEFHKWENVAPGRYRTLPTNYSMHGFVGIRVTTINANLVTTKSTWTTFTSADQNSFKWIWNAERGAYTLSSIWPFTRQTLNLVADNGPYVDRVLKSIVVGAGQNKFPEWILIPYGKGNLFYLYNTVFKAYAYQNDNFGTYNYRVRLGGGLIEGGRAAANGPNALKSLFELR